MNNDADKIIAHWDAHEFSKLTGGEPVALLLKRIGGGLPIGSRVLEIGCGDGRLLELFKNHELFGVDIAPTHLERIRKRGIKAIEGDARSLPFEKDSFDFVFSWGTVEHFPETQQAIKEHVRVCKPGGKILITVPNKISINALEMKIINIIRGVSEEEQVARFGKRYSGNTLIKMCRNSGMKKIKLLYVGDIFAPHPKIFNRFIRHPHFLRRGIACVGEK